MVNFEIISVFAAVFIIVVGIAILISRRYKNNYYPIVGYIVGVIILVAIYLIFRI